MQDLNTISFFISSVSSAEGEPGLSGTGLQIADKIQIHEPVWYFIYLFILLAIYAWINVYYGNVLVQTFRASINFKLANKMFNSSSQVQSQLDTTLYLFYFLSLAFMLYYVEIRINRFPYDFRGGLLFLFNLGFLALLFFGRIVIHNIAGFLFNRVKIIREYLYNMFIFNKLTGLVAPPLIFLMVYTRGALQDIVFWTSIIVLSGIFLLRVIRGIIYSYQKDVLNFYMFLYLCALEIVPVVLLYRWLEGIL